MDPDLFGGTKPEMNKTQNTNAHSIQVSLWLRDIHCA